MDYYKDFRLSKLTTPKFRHILLLIYWPVYVIGFYCLEHVLPLKFHAVECGIDSLIPFCEYFIVPYLFWFIFVFAMIVYSFFREIPLFRRYMWFIIVSYTVTCIIYLIYPTKQELRPEIKNFSNIFLYATSMIYRNDTNTNVCPSLHVIGSMAVVFSVFASKTLRHPAFRLSVVAAALIICASTVFLKQHSFIDIVAGLALSALLSPIFFFHRQERPEKPDNISRKKILTAPSEN